MMHDDPFERAAKREQQENRGTDFTESVWEFTQDIMSRVSENLLGEGSSLREYVDKEVDRVSEQVTESMRMKEDWYWPRMNRSRKWWR